MDEGILVRLQYDDESAHMSLEGSRMRSNPMTTPGDHGRWILSTTASEKPARAHASVPYINGCSVGPGNEQSNSRGLNQSSRLPGANEQRYSNALSWSSRMAFARTATIGRQQCTMPPHSRYGTAVLPLRARSPILLVQHGIHHQQ